MAIQLLGPVRAWRDQERVALRGVTSRSVLARLALAYGSVVSIEALMEALWGDDPPARPAADVHTVVSRLRRALGTEAIQTSPGGYALSADVSTDVAELEGLLAEIDQTDPASAVTPLHDLVAAWGESPLEDVASTLAFEPYRVKLAELQRNARDRLDALLLAVGRAEEAIPDLRRRAETEPLRESTQLLLAEALARVGRATEALRVIDRFRATLVETSGLQPSHEADVLERRLLEGHSPPLASGPSDVLDGRHHGVQRRGSMDNLWSWQMANRQEQTASSQRLAGDDDRVYPSGDTSIVGLRAASGSPMVGRQAELDRLMAAFATVRRASRPRVVMLSGEAGVGKTRLVGELAVAVQAVGCRMVVGRCIQGGHDVLPLAALRDILISLVDTLDSETLDAVIGPARAGLARLVPELGSVGVRAPPDDVCELAVGVVRRLALRGVVVVVVEDLHWADRSTRELFSLLATTHWLGPVLVVGTCRDDELHRRHPLRQVLAAVARAEHHERIELAGLAEAEVAALMAASGEPADPFTVTEIARRTGGLPFFVEELIAARAAGRGDLPVTLRDAVLARAAPLDENAWGVLAVVAVAGPVSALVAAEARGIDEGLLDGAVEQLRAAGLVLVDGDRLRTRHDLAREIVYDEIGPIRRASVHTRLAAALELLEPDRLGEIARHRHAANDQPGALAASLAAGRQFLRSGAASEAHLQFERALELWDRLPDAATLTGVDRSDLLILASSAAKHANQADMAITVARAALDELAGTDPMREGEAWVHLRSLYAPGDPPDERSAAERRALALLPESPPSAARAKALAYAALTAFDAFDSASAAEYARTAAAMASSLDDPDTSVLAEIAMHSAALAADASSAAEHAQAAVNACDPRVATELAVLAHSALTDAHFTAGHLHQLAAVAERGADLAQRRGLSGATGPWVAGTLVYALVELGAWDRVEAVVDEHRNLLERLPDRGTRFTARLRIRQGRLDDARSLVTQLRQLLDHGYAAAGLPDIVATILEMDAADRRTDTVHHYFEPLLQLTHLAPGSGHPISLAVRALANGLEDTSRPPAGPARSQAASIATSWLRTIESDHPASPPRGRIEAADHELARAELSRIRADPQPLLWEANADRWKALHMPYQEAYARYRAAEAHLTGGRAQTARRAAKTQTDQALDIATRLGSVHLAGAITLLANRSPHGRRTNVRTTVGTQQTEAAPEPRSRQADG